MQWPNITYFFNLTHKIQKLEAKRAQVWTSWWPPWELTHSTGKSLSEALLFAEHEENMLCTKIVWMSETVSVHNMFSPCLSLELSCIELVIEWTMNIFWVRIDAKIRASDKDLPVLLTYLFQMWLNLKYILTKHLSDRGCE